MSEVSHYRILLIDDSKSFISGIKSLLSGHPFEVIGITSPKEALNTLETINPDIVITDLDMPSINGFELIRQIREKVHKKYYPIMVLSTRMENLVDISNSVDCGADAFSSKDNIRTSLVPQIKALIRLKQLHETAIKGKQLEAVQALIGTYKHEFGNSLAILLGMFRKLIKYNPSLKEDPSVASIQEALSRIDTTLKKLSKLREYKETDYSEKTKILKVG